MGKASVLLPRRNRVMVLLLIKLPTHFRIYLEI